MSHQNSCFSIASNAVRCGVLVLGCWSASLASATSFSTFLQYETATDALIRGDGYPGRMKLLNARRDPVCVYFRYKNEQGEVLRLSKVGNRIPGARLDLAVTGPGLNARSLEVAVEYAQRDVCGSFGENDGRSVTIVRQGEAKNGNGFEVDARSWSGNSRDITVHIR